jgi:HPP family
MMNSGAPELLIAGPELREALTWKKRYGGEVVALSYIVVIAAVAVLSGAYYVMFPELAALSHESFTRPHGRWASAPLMLVITPALTGLIGIAFTRMLPYGYFSVLLTVGGAILVIELLKSPIAPAISAGLLPLVIGVTSWWYPVGVLFGTALLALVSMVWKRMVSGERPTPEPRGTNAIDAVIATLPTGRYWAAALFAFVIIALTCVKLTGLRFILFPPLVVIAFEMLGHPAECPWARRPWMLPLVCFLTAMGGLVAFKLFGFGPLTAATAMAWGILVLRVTNMHVPPALAVALLPLVMNQPGFAYPFSVAFGTTAITVWFLAYGYFVDENCTPANLCRLQPEA